VGGRRIGRSALRAPLRPTSPQRGYSPGAPIRQSGTGLRPGLFMARVNACPSGFWASMEMGGSGRVCVRYPHLGIEIWAPGVWVSWRLYTPPVRKGRVRMGHPSAFGWRGEERWRVGHPPYLRGKRGKGKCGGLSTMRFALRSR
jgi:hypothetical protein